MEAKHARDYGWDSSLNVIVSSFFSFFLGVQIIYVVWDEGSSKSISYLFLDDFIVHIINKSLMD